jgi:NADPH:quinone reductase-like Zn-dependent oxidoreductase
MSATVDCLPKRMNAVVNHGRGDFRYEELRVPQPGREEVLIRLNHGYLRQ